MRVATKAPARPVGHPPGGAADRAGIKPGDVITALDGQPITDEDAFVVAIRAHAPGDVGDADRAHRVEVTAPSSVTLQGSSD